MDKKTLKQKKRASVVLGLKIALWVAEIAVFAYFITIVFKSHLAVGRHYLWIGIFAILFLAIYLYCKMMPPIWRAIKALIYHLAGSEESDDETDRTSGYIAAAVIFVGTLIWMLLAFNYYAHSASADRKAREQTSFSGTSNRPAVNHAGDRDTTSGKLNSVLKDSSNSELPPPTWIETTGGFLGTFGDFFGGVANPILTFLTLVALAITLLLQRVQLKDARKEAKESGKHASMQAFETTFFNMINLHTEIVRGLTFNPSVIKTAISTDLDDDARTVFLALGPQPLADAVCGRAVFAEVLRSTARGASIKQGQIEIYRFLQDEHNDVLGHYFRHLYQILDLLNRLEINSKPVDWLVRKRYANIIRAQLSSFELSVLLLNCTGTMVDKGRFRALLIEYEFLEHLPISISEDFQLSAPMVVGNNDLIFFEYFGVNYEMKPYPRWTTGAFGKNPQIGDFLGAQGQKSWDKPEPPQR